MTDLDPDDGQPIYYHALHREVMAVAKMQIGGVWKSYVFPVPGRNHLREWQCWRDKGAALPEAVARAIFGFIENVPYSP